MSRLPTTSPDEVRVRPRRAADLAPLGAALLAQQPGSRYPFRNPLPVPVEEFMHAHDAAGAWTAELDGRPVGHVCRTGPVHGFPDADEMNEHCARAHGCDTGGLAWIRTLFVADEARGLGVGRRLLAAVVADIRSQGLHPCLEVLPVHAAATALYLDTGWRVVHRTRPAWLRAAPDDDVPAVQVMVLLDGNPAGT